MKNKDIDKAIIRVEFAALHTKVKELKCELGQSASAYNEMCGGYEAELDKLRTDNEKLRKTMQLHAGDICSLNNEVGRFVADKEELEVELKELKSDFNIEIEGHKASQAELEKLNEINNDLICEVASLQLQLEGDG